MKFFVALIALFVAVNAVTIEEAIGNWNVFKTTHSKKYHPKEEQVRFQIFQDSLRQIEEHNAKYENGEVSYYLTVTPFADWTSEEFKAMLNSQISTKPARNSTNKFVVDPNAEVPESIDWREQGAVLSVKDQGSTCGSCWAFSTTGALEGQNAIRNNKKVSLSEQQLVDCDTQSQGCQGGWMDYGFEYVKQNGICSEDSYAYKGEDGECQKCEPVLSTVKGYKDLDANEKSLEAGVALVGPISIGVSATTEWKLYGGGVFSQSSCNSEEINHGVLAVGYTSDYWIIKNSWSEAWGEKGYIRMIKGRNECHVSDVASYPVL